MLIGLVAASIATAPRTAADVAARTTHWPNGRLRSSATVVNYVYEGEYRTWYEDGHPYELRHFVHGRESGLQRSWSDDGTLYLNYEVRGGRRYGFVNAIPCLPAAADGTSRAGS